MRLIDEKIAERTEKARVHDKNAEGYQRQMENQQSLANIQRECIASLERDKAILLEQTAMKPGKDAWTPAVGA